MKELQQLVAHYGRGTGRLKDTQNRIDILLKNGYKVTVVGKNTHLYKGDDTDNFKTFETE